ncbi:MAG: hypothetical protein EHM30_12250 [Desulfobacteraceae bacterium]|nr:MAG: hypothetical protein EHM30_12250 [Desulfobacteraceae bacterium]
MARGVKKYTEGGADAFFVQRKGRGGGVITKEVRSEAQDLLNQGYNKKEIAEKLGIKYDTIRKAISDGRLSVSLCETVLKSAKNKSSRSKEDSLAQMGTACTRPIERCFAAVGLMPEGAPTRFESSLDVSFGGVLCALPALSANGLFNYANRCLKTLSGYYTTLHVLIVVA